MGLLRDRFDWKGEAKSSGNSSRGAEAEFGLYPGRLYTDSSVCVCLGHSRTRIDEHITGVLGRFLMNGRGFRLRL